MENIKINYKKRNILLVILLSIVMITMLIFIFWTDKKINLLLKSDSDNENKYNYHFSMVIDSADNPYWDIVYKSAENKAKQMDSILEIAATSLPETYSLYDKLNMAIAEKVDGIIVVPDGSDVINSMISNATNESDINVISLMENDSPCGRNGYIGINSYDQGIAYGSLLSQLASKRDSLNVVLLKPGSKQIQTSENYSSNVIYSGLVEYINSNNLSDKIQITIESINQVSTFNCKRDIQQLLSVENPPDVIICSDYLFTISACQIVVDRNLVGNVQILGSYISKDILDYIQKGTMYGTVAVDPYKLGEVAIEEMIELKTINRTNDYMALEMLTIDQNNINEYINMF